MKFNIKRDDLNDFSRCLHLVTNKIGYIALDNEDIYNAFGNADEIGFFTASANSPMQAYTDLIKKIPEEHFDAGLIVFSIRQDSFDTVVIECETVWNHIIRSRFHNNDNVLLGLYSTDQNECCSLYFLCSKHNDADCESPSDLT